MGWGWGSGRVLEQERRENHRGTPIYLCVEDSKGARGELQEQRVDDVIPIGPTNLVLYIIIPDPPPLPLQPTPLYPEFCLVNGSFCL